jgi:hypothetical protein
LNHSQSLQEAFAEHKKEGFPLPLGTRCLVHGPCRQPDCSCDGKKMLIREYFVIEAGPEKLA